MDSSTAHSPSRTSRGYPCTRWSGKTLSDPLFRLKHNHVAFANDLAGVRERRRLATLAQESGIAAEDEPNQANQAGACGERYGEYARDADCGGRKTKSETTIAASSVSAYHGLTSIVPKQPHVAWPDRAL